MGGVLLGGGGLGTGVLAPTPSYCTLCVLSFQIPFDLALKHKAVVADIATNAHKDKRRSLLGVLYDEFAR